MRILSGGWRRAEAYAFLVPEGRLAAALRGAPSEIARAAKALARRHDLKGDVDDEAVGSVGDRLLVLVGAGGGSPREAQEAAARAAAAAARGRARSVVLGAGALRGALGAVCDIALGARLGRYRFDRYKKKKRPPTDPDVVVAAAAPPGGAARALRRAEILADATARARDLVNEPPAEKPPARAAAAIAARLGALRGVRVRRFGPADLERMRCHAILAVGRGSAHPPAALRAEWRPRGARRHLVLVGKGLTFDSGGLNIKPYEGMRDMKCDIGGAAAVAGALEAIARLRVPIRVTMLSAFAENMPGSRAYKPGDVLRGRSGTSIEVLNTDAEGRVLLSDILALAAEEAPDLVVDVATLTGAIVRALGDTRTGLFAPRDEDAVALERAAARAGEPLWRMPMGPDYRKLIKGQVGDVKNVGGAGAGASTAAHFLAEFVGKTPWAHLDVAGTAWTEKGTPLCPPGGTGAAVGTLLALAEDLAAG